MNRRKSQHTWDTEGVRECGDVVLLGSAILIEERWGAADREDPSEIETADIETGDLIDVVPVTDDRTKDRAKGRS